LNLLLDTHALIWSFKNNPRLSAEAKAAIVDGRNLVFVSAATAWEIAIKKALGKLKSPDNYEEELARHRFTSLDITTPHALAVQHLPPTTRIPSTGCWWRRRSSSSSSSSPAMRTSRNMASE
jgi:PIN domain nuclease of toxin-antitoxin system